MEKIEREIAKVNTDIETVAFQIEAVEALLKKNFTDWTEEERNAYGEEGSEARKVLREKENKLRDKEIKLREEKNKLNDILLEKERQRTQGVF